MKRSPLDLGGGSFTLNCLQLKKLRETIKGSEEFIEIKKSKTKRKEVKGINVRLDEFIEKS